MPDWEKKIEIMLISPKLEEIASLIFFLRMRMKYQNDWRQMKNTYFKKLQKQAGIVEQTYKCIMQEPETEGHKSYIVFSYMGSQRPAWVDELSLHETQRHAHEEKKITAVYLYCLPQVRQILFSLNSISAPVLLLSYHFPFYRYEN